MLSPATEQWLRHRYELQMSTDAVRRDLGEILGHGEPGAASGKARSPSTQPDAGRGVLGRRADTGPGQAVAEDGHRVSETSPAERSPPATAWWSSTSAAAGRTPLKGGSA